MTNKIILSLLVVAIIGGGLFYFLKPKAQVNSTKNQPITTPTQAKKTGTVSPTQAEIKDTVINISGFAFNPPTITVKSGTKVTWINQDSAPHTIKSAAFTSGTINQGDKFEFTFKTAGTFDYSCGIHPSMAGKVIVQ